MRRADRLFRLIQILRRARRPVTAQALAEELEISKRSVYRDIADLVANRTPISGEAGVGYVLDRAFDMPPLMLTPDELEAAALGAQWVATRGDAALALAARDLLAKIAAVTPERLRAFVEEPTVEAAPPFAAPPDAVDSGALREAIRRGRKVRLDYRDGAGEVSARVVWPVVLGYVERARMLAGWCELRADFRHFRVDRIVAAEVMAERYPERPAALRARWRAGRRDYVAGNRDPTERSRPGGSSRSGPE